MIKSHLKIHGGSWVYFSQYSDIYVVQCATSGQSLTDAIMACIEIVDPQAAGEINMMLKGA